MLFHYAIVDFNRIFLTYLITLKVKVLAKLGLVTAAAATVLFIFIYEIQGPVINRVMSQAPAENNETPKVEAKLEEPVISETPDNEVTAETEESTESLGTTETESVDPVPDTEESTITAEADVEPETVEQPIKVEAPPVEEKVKDLPTRRIYGKITLSTSGELLEGVNIMVPGSSVAKVSNANGGYTIEVPKTLRELVFIYRGKKLVQRINSDNNLVNVRLDLETMQYD